MNRIAQLADHLRDLGYSGEDGAVAEGYEYLSPGYGRLRADLVAFADPWSLDISTACIVVNVSPNLQDATGSLKHLRYMGAPVALIAFPEHVWIGSVSTKPDRDLPFESVPYDQLGSYLAERSGELSPRSLSAVKRGARQLSFLEADPSLVGFAETATQRSIVARFTDAVSSVDAATREAHPMELTRLSIWLLAARILQDKLGWQRGEYLDLHDASDANSLLQAAASHFSDYFTGIDLYLTRVGPDAAEVLYSGLRNTITFRSLTNDSLGYFYEHALIDEELRKASGVYYTPRAIAERILHRLPVEDLPMAQRKVFDGTCGSGNLLLAAHKRLAKLLPGRLSAKERHDYLKSHVWGLDKDPFACEVARLSLFLFSLPAGNDWHIEQGDIFAVAPKSTFGSNPDIIVGNPPFHEPRTDAGRREQKAAKVFQQYLRWLRPGGLIGTVLPITLLQNRSGQDAREQLLRGFDVLELWHLPEGAIPGSAAGTAVVLARKLPQGSARPVGRFTRVEKGKKIIQQTDAVDGAALLSYQTPHLALQDRWLNASTFEMKSSPLDDLWSRLANYPRLDPERRILFNGIQVGKLARPTHFAREDLGPQWRKALYKNSGGKVLGPFRINWAIQEQRYMRYPSPEIQWPRDEAHFDAPVKVVFNATRNAGSPWRFYAAIDRDMLLVTENFHYALPQHGIQAEMIAVVLNSALANAWYASRNYQRDVNLSHLRTLPFPAFTLEQTRRCRGIAVRITAAHHEATGDTLLVAGLLKELDDLVFDVYGCSKTERDSVLDFMAGSRRPGLEHRKTSKTHRSSDTDSGPLWRVLGEVEDVDTERYTVKLWLQGMRSSVEVPIHGKMPGWMLRPETAFVATIPLEQRSASRHEEITWIDFEPVEYAYLSVDDLKSAFVEDGLENR